MTPQLMTSAPSLFDHPDGAHRIAPEELHQVEKTMRRGHGDGNHEPVGAEVDGLHQLVPGEHGDLDGLPEHHRHQRCSNQRATFGEQRARCVRNVRSEQFVANKRAFDALTPAQQKQLRDSMHKALVWQRDRARVEENESIAEIKKRGMQFEEVTPQFRGELRKASAGIVDEAKKRIGADIVNRVQDEIAKK